ncbi:MAG: crossover junction endodeoxyribonuclease RuvC [Holosporales bacterium]|jgi:crossover junction endodeoxyribonuclease RuvC|nr:crossover junction endodeoxyribonuclease RuvC [Holosporales bacterium]
MRILGVDPGLRYTGWGVIDGTRCLGHGVLSVPSSIQISDRLAAIYQGLMALFNEYQPSEVAIESVFVNSNGSSTMKLCMARGVAVLVPGILGIEVFEYSTTLIKKTITGHGHAQKPQVNAMVKAIISGVACQSNMDETDALAVALCHERHKTFNKFNIAC